MSVERYKHVGQGEIKASDRRIRRTRRKVEDSCLHRRSSMVVSITFGLLALGALGAICFVYFRSRPAAESKALVEHIDAVNHALDSLESLSGDEDDIQQEAERLNRAVLLLRNFSKAEDLETLSDLVCDPELHRSAMAEFLSEKSIQPMKVMSRETTEIDGRQYLRVLCHSAGRARVIDIDLASGLIDWESFTGANAAELEDLLWRSEGLDTKALRVFLRWGESVNYYNYEYKDSERWACFQLNHPDLLRSAWVYLERNSELYFELMQRGRTSQGNISVVVRVKPASEEARERGQFELEELISPTWRIPENSVIANYGKESGE